MLLRDGSQHNVQGTLPPSFVQAMDDLNVVPGLWGNPKLQGIPQHWEEKQKQLEEDAARQYDNQVTKVDVIKAADKGDVDDVKAYLIQGGRVDAKDTVCALLLAALLSFSVLCCCPSGSDLCDCLRYLRTRIETHICEDTDDLESESGGGAVGCGRGGETPQTAFQPLHSNAER